jgi:uncharacterized membrane protein
MNDRAFVSYSLDRHSVGNYHAISLQKFLQARSHARRSRLDARILMERSFFSIFRCLFVTWCLVALFASLAACSREQRYAAPPIDGDNVSIQVASLPPEIPQFYSYRTKGKSVDFFVLRLQDRVLSFLDACLSCYPRKLGYGSKDGFVVCRACRTTYSVYKLEKGIGGCYPIQITGSREKGNYLIPLLTLDRHANKF